MGPKREVHGGTGEEGGLFSEYVFCCRGGPELSKIMVREEGEPFGPGGGTTASCAFMCFSPHAWRLSPRRSYGTVRCPIGSLRLVLSPRLAPRSMALTGPGSHAHADGVSGRKVA